MARALKRRALGFSVSVTGSFTVFLEQLSLVLLGALQFVPFVEKQLLESKVERLIPPFSSNRRRVVLWWPW
jgi:hypothetical protein